MIKEIAILDKEKAEIQKQIEIALGRLDRLEAEVGLKEKGATMVEENNEQFINNNSSTEKFNVDNTNNLP